MFNVAFAFSVSALRSLTGAMQKDIWPSIALPQWLWPLCRRTSLLCLFQSGMWVQMWFPLHLRSKIKKLQDKFLNIMQWLNTWTQNSKSCHMQCNVTCCTLQCVCMGQFAEEFSNVLNSSPKCKKTFPSFFSMLSWSLLRSSWYCCCLIFPTMYSASCEGKQNEEVTFLALKVQLVRAETADYQH